VWGVVPDRADHLCHTAIKQQQADANVRQIEPETEPQVPGGIGQCAVRMTQSQLYDLASAYIDRVEKLDLPPFDRPGQHSRVKYTVSIDPDDRTILEGDFNKAAQDVSAKSKPDRAGDLHRHVIRGQKRDGDAGRDAHRERENDAPSPAAIDCCVTCTHGESSRDLGSADICCPTNMRLITIHKNRIVLNFQFC
jgi:hypothetical protein